MFSIFVALCLFGGAFAQEFSFGACPPVTTVEDFSIVRILGRWYDVQKYFSAAEIGRKCITYDYSLGTSNNTIAIVNSFTGRCGTRRSVKAIACTPDLNQPGKFKVKFSDDPFPIERDYWILGTDYESYVVVYNCRNLWFSSAKHAWILTRDRNPSAEIIEKALKVAENGKLERSKFIKTQQSGCDNKVVEKGIFFN